MSETQAFENWQNLNESIEIDPEELKAYEKQYKKLKNKELINQVQVYVKSIGTNLKYSLEDMMGITLNKMLLKDQNINLLGQQINQDFSQEQVRRLMLSLSWFSYRKNMPFIISKEGKAFSTDANWGCTIRVAQMFLYSIIWEHLERKYNISKKFDMKVIQQIRDNLLKNFFDNNWAIFSLHKFCSIGLERQNSNVGEFWRPNITISNMIRIIEKKQQIELFKDQNNTITFNTSEIAIDLSTIGIITYEDIFKKVYSSQTSQCCCIKKQNQNWGFYTLSVDLSDMCKECDFNKTLIIFCFLRTGLVKPEPENIKYIRQLIESKFFAGGVIGKGNSALFLLGNQGSNYIYLDPHYVQETNQKNPQNLFSSYNVQNFRTIDENYINPCVGLALRASNYKEYKKLHSYIDELAIKFKDSFYLSFNYYDENMQLYSQLIYLNYNMKLKIFIFLFCFLSRFKFEDMAEAEPMEEAIKEEAQHPEDDVDQSPVDEEEGEINEQEENNVLKSDENLEVEKIQNTLDKCKLDIEECLDRIDDSEWSEQMVEKCIGPDHLKIHIIINYEKDRILSKYDANIKKAMWKFCYAKAGEDLEMSQSCDEIESDVIDFLWSILDFGRLLDINRSKYTEEIGIMSIESYEKILDKLSKIQKELFALLSELNSQSSALLLKIDNYIDEKTQLLKKEIEEHPEKARMLKKTKIIITTDTPLSLDLKKLPKKQSALLDHLLSEKYTKVNKSLFTIDEIQKRQQARQLMKNLKMGEELKKLKNVAPKNWMKEMLRLSLLKKKKVGNFLKVPHINVHDKYRKTSRLKYTKIKN